MRELSYSGNTVEIGENTVELPYSIDDLITIGNKIIVLIEVPVDEEYPHNVVAINKRGDISWQIDSPDEGEYNQPYHFITTRDGELYATNWDGYKYYVDITTGKVERYQKMDK